MAAIGVYASRLRQSITALDDAHATLVSARQSADASAFGGAAASDRAGRDALDASQAAYDARVHLVIDDFVSSRRASYGEAHLAALAVSNQDIYESYRNTGG